MLGLPTIARGPLQLHHLRWRSGEVTRYVTATLFINGERAGTLIQYPDGGDRVWACVDS